MSPSKHARPKSDIGVKAGDQRQIANTAHIKKDSARKQGGETKLKHRNELKKQQKKALLRSLHDARCAKKAKQEEQLATAIKKVLVEVVGDPPLPPFEVLSRCSSFAGSLSLQCAVRDGPPELLKGLFDVMLSQGRNKTVFAELCTTAFGVCLAITTLSQSFTVPDYQKKFLGIVQENASTFVFHKNAARITDYVYRKCRRKRFLKAQDANRIMNAAQFSPGTLRLLPSGSASKDFSQAWAELVELQPQAVESALGYLEQACDRILDKNLCSYRISQAVLRNFCRVADDARRRRLASRVLDANAEQSVNILQFLFTKEGPEVLCYLLGYINAKARRKFIADIKRSRKVEEVLFHETGYLVLVRLLSVLDDTKLAWEIVKPWTYCTCGKSETFGHGMAQLQPCAVMQYLTHKNGRQLFMHFLNPSSKNGFSQLEYELLLLPSPASLKPQRDRFTQVGQMLVQALYVFFQAHLTIQADTTDFFFRASHLVLVEVLVAKRSDTAFLSDVLDSLGRRVQEELSERHVLNSSYFCRRMVKAFLRDSYTSAIPDDLIQFVLEHVEKFIRSKSIYVLVDLSKQSKRFRNSLRAIGVVKKLPAVNPSEGLKMLQTLLSA